MKIAGHTMATPELNLQQAVKLFADIGLEGIEIICTEDYLCGIDLTTSPAEIDLIRQLIQDRGMCVPAIVPYIKDVNSSNPGLRAASIESYKKVIEIASRLECPAIRVFAGHEAEASDLAAAMDRLVASLQLICLDAEQSGIQLVIENHVETMATSAAITAEIVKHAACDNVGILYDQANLTLLGQEAYPQAIALQRNCIRHVHVKDFEIVAGRYRPTVLGQGTMPWLEILNNLAQIGYAEFLTLEYERRWHPDELPVAAIGLRQSATYIRELLSP